MKKTILLAVILLLIPNYSAFAQGNNNSNSCYPTQPDAFWHFDSPGSKRIAECTLPTYNCHGFAIAYFEGGCNSIGYNSNILGGYLCPSSYFGNQTPSITGIRSAQDYKMKKNYFRVNTEASADLVYYAQATTSGDHTAVKDPTYSGQGIKYISKYGGDGPIGGHDLTGSWYHIEAQNSSTFVVSPPEFWAYIKGISPANPTTIIAGNTQIFSVPNKSGLTYQWSLSSGIASIQGSTNSHSVTVRGDYGGTLTLNCIVTSTVEAKTSTFTVDIIVQSQNITGNYSTSAATNAYLNTVNFVPAGNMNATAQCGSPSNSVIWTKTSGSASTTQIGNTVYFNMPSNSSMNFSVSSTCGGSGTTTRNITFYNFGNFLAYPNPTSGEITLNTGINLDFTVEIISEKTLRKSSQKSFKKKTQIDISSLESGVYIVRLYYRDRLLKTNKIIRK